MLSYHNFCLQDGEKIRSYTMDSEIRICGYSISNLYAWNNVYKTQWAEFKGFLVIRYWYNGELIYFFPVGKGDIREVIVQLREEAVSQEFNLKIIGPMEIVRRELEDYCSINFNFNSNRDASEYVYLRSALESLSGKKLQPKRNHINKFKLSYPNYRFESLSRENIQDCYKMEERWALAHGNENKAVVVEKDVIHRALENIDVLDVVGGVLYVDNEVVAFTFGCAINRDTFGVQVEKADVNFIGAYPMINQEFVKSLPEHFIYINREEDLGEENLRKAKLSYYPQMLIEVGYASWAQPIESKYFKNQLKQQWASVFNLLPSTIDLYLKMRYTQDNTMAILEGDKIVSSVQLCYFKMNFGTEIATATYLSYVYTDEEYRGKGYMSKLYKDAFNRLYSEKAPMAFLITYEDYLKSIYNNWGFESVIKYASKKIDMSLFDCQNSDEYKLQYLYEYDAEVYSYLSDYLQLQDYSLSHFPCYFNYLIEDLRIGDGGSCIVVRKGAAVCGLSVVYYVSGNVYIHILICSVDEIRDLIYSEIQKRYSPKCVYQYEACKSDMLNDSSWYCKNMGMIRIVHLEEFLKLYAKTHPQERFVYSVADDKIVENNGVFIVEDAKMRRCESDDVMNDSIQSVSINELTIKLLDELNLYAPLMMEPVLPTNL